MGVRALDILSLILTHAREKLDRGEELTKVELDAAKYVMAQNPGMLRHTPQEPETEEGDMEELTTEQLLEKERKRKDASSKEGSAGTGSPR